MPFMIQMVCSIGSSNPSANHHPGHGKAPPKELLMQQDFRACSVEGCERNASRAAEGKRGFCSMHYQRWKRRGAPTYEWKKPSPALDWLRAHVRHTADKCLAWPFHIGRDGYGRVHRPDDWKLTTASRLMCEFAHGPAPSRKHEAAHSCGCGDKACVNPRHLYWATSTENHADKVGHGTTNRGEQHGAHKLIADDVAEIRRLAEALTQSEIARRYAICQSQVSNIVRGKAWAWLD